MKKLIIYLLLAAALNFPVAAQEKQIPAKKDDQEAALERMNEFSRTISAKINMSGGTGNILTRMEETRRVALDHPPETKPEEYGFLTTFLANYAAKLGNYADAIRYLDFDSRKYPNDSPNGDALAGFKPVPAIEAISQAAEKSQIVIVNEAHHVPQHRAFTTELLKKLKKKGYKYFAAETLYNGDAGPNKADIELNKRGYPVKASATYAEEPVLGDMLRTALRLGYKLVPYDAGFDSNGGLSGPEARERGAAANLEDRIFKDDPNAKVLIHVGYAHNSENENVYRKGVKGMAGYLKEATGIDPLTVDQTLMSEHSAAEYERPLYRLVTRENNFTEPTVYRNAKGEFWKLPNSGQDITVFSPRSVYRDGRPHWLEFGGTRKQYLLPPDVCAAEKHCLVRARFAGESADAIPVDQIEARANQKNALLLPKGNFVIEAEDAKGVKLKTWQTKK